MTEAAKVWTESSTSGKHTPAWENTINPHLEGQTQQHGKDLNLRQSSEAISTMESTNQQEVEPDLRFSWSITVTFDWLDGTKHQV